MSASEDFIELGVSDDAELRHAIGGVCMHWSWLELIVEQVISHLAKTDSLAFDATFAENQKILRKLALASDQLTAEQKSEVAQLLDQLGDLALERHRIVHGMWSEKQNGVFQSVFPYWRRTDASSTGKAMSIEDIRQVKLRIVRWARAMQKFRPEMHAYGIKPVAKS